STAYQHWTGFNQPYNDYDRTDPRWFYNAQRTDTALNINPDCAYTFGCTQWISNSNDQRTEDTRRVLIGSLSYVTGTHNIKVGIVVSSICELKKPRRSEEHTSELQSLAYLVCRLLLEKKKQ